MIIYLRNQNDSDVNNDMYVYMMGSQREALSTIRNILIYRT